MQLTENEVVKYRVIHNGSILLESVPKLVAEQFVASLAKTIQETVEIVPVTSDGMQILLG